METGKWQIARHVGRFAFTLASRDGILTVRHRTGQPKGERASAMKTLHVEDRETWHSWLAQHHDEASEIWLLFHKTLMQQVVKRFERRKYRIAEGFREK